MQHPMLAIPSECLFWQYVAGIFAKPYPDFDDAVIVAIACCCLARRFLFNQTSFITFVAFSFMRCAALRTVSPLTPCKVPGSKPIGLATLPLLWSGNESPMSLNRLHVTFYLVDIDA